MVQQWAQDLVAALPIETTAKHRLLSGCLLQAAEHSQLVVSIFFVHPASCSSKHLLLLMSEANVPSSSGLFADVTTVRSAYTCPMHARAMTHLSRYASGNSHACQWPMQAQHLCLVGQSQDHQLRYLLHH